MTSSNAIKRSFLETLAERGVSSAHWNTYQRMLDELVVFMEGVHPSTWRLVDLERFYRLRRLTLAREETSIYGMALGIVSEVLLEQEKSELSNDSPNSEELCTSSQLGLEDTQTAYALTSRPKTGSSIPPVKAKQDDFLGENQEQWTSGRLTPATKRTGTIKANEFVRPTTGLSQRPKTGPLRRPQTGAAKKETLDQRPFIDVTYDKVNGIIVLTWNGHVTGTSLRNTIRDAMEWARRRNTGRWLVDMRNARVMTPEDSEWFSNWLADAGRRGVQLFAIVPPTHTITKMQMGRLRDVADASTIAFMDQHRVRTAFFDSELEARIWLTRIRKGAGKK